MIELNKLVKHTILICCSSFLMCAIIGCDNVKAKGGDDFYTWPHESWDAIRIPLIKPYEMIKLNGSKGWNMNLMESAGDISNIKEMNFLQNIIVIHSGETRSIDLDSRMWKEGWFIFIPDKHIEKGFEKKEDFNKYADSLHVTDPRFYDADKVYDAFDMNDSIDWKKGYK